MKKLIIPILCLCLLACNQTAKKEEVKEATLKEALDGKFHIGAAMNINQIFGVDSLGVNVVKKHYNSIVAENCMKSMFLQPKEGEFFFDEADKFVAFGEENNMFIIGHCLVWHSQAPAWFFTDENGNDVSKEVLIERMKNHITTIVTRYKGRIHGWDVVNESILDDGSWRQSKFYTIIGEEFMDLAFQFAHAADPDAELYYNDYNEWHAGKRGAIVELIKSFQEKGIRIDAIGMQGHIGMDYPSLEEYQKTIDDYSATGVKVMVTELDMSALPNPRQNVGANIADVEAYRQEVNPYVESLPDSVAAAWTQRFEDYFVLFLNNKEKITRVTLWGVSDGDSWKNNFPMYGRTDYPLLFDREYNAKPIVERIIYQANNQL
jgi:Beta-1,4-xylanase